LIRIVHQIPRSGDTVRVTDKDMKLVK